MSEKTVTYKMDEVLGTWRDFIETNRLALLMKDSYSDAFEKLVFKKVSVERKHRKDTNHEATIMTLIFDCEGEKVQVVMDEWRNINVRKNSFELYLADAHAVFRKFMYELDRTYQLGAGL